MSHSVDARLRHEARRMEHGTSGKGVAHVPPGEGTRSLWVLGELVTHKVPSHQTGGAYSLFEVATEPGAGPPPHIHHREDESFYDLDGNYEFLVDGHTLKAGRAPSSTCPRASCTPTRTSARARAGCC